MAKYGFQFKNTVGIDGSPRFIALEQGEIDIVDAFATDGLLKKYGLVTLEDTDGYFPPYNAIPMLRGEVWRSTRNSPIPSTSFLRPSPTRKCRT